LLLDMAQSLDEERGPEPESGPGQTPQPATGLAALARFEGVAFLLAVPKGEKEPLESWSLENSAEVAAWARATQERLTKLGETLQAGAWTGVTGFGLQEHCAVQANELKGLLCVGLRPALGKEEVEQTVKLVIDTWAS
jgi:hypothetical protein